MFAARTVLFAVYMFLYTTTLQLGSSAAAEVLPARQQEQLYYVQQIFLLLGFVSFAALHRPLRTARRRRALTAAAAFIFAAGVAVLFAVRSDAVCRCVAPATVLCLAYLGALVYWRMSEAAGRGGRIGASMGVGAAAAYAMQFLMQIWRGGAALLPAAMLAAFAAMAYLLLRETADAAGSPEAGAPQERASTLSLVCACVAAAALVLLNCFYDGYIVHMQAASNNAYSALSLPRLLLVPCSLLFGLIGDVSSGRYFPFAVLCAVLVTLLNPALAEGADAYLLNMCLFYVGVAATISYYNLTFWRLAPRTRRPELWAGMGRVINGIVGVALGMLHFSGGSQAAVLGADAAALAALVAAMALDGKLSFAPALAAHTPEAAAVPASPPPDAEPKTEETPPDPFAVMKGKYGLTDREVLVLRELVLTEDIQPVIGDRLSIKVSTVQSYVTSLYRKTGVSTRVGLSDLYHEALRHG